MQIDNLRNVSFKGLVCVRGPREVAEIIVEETGAELDSFESSTNPPLHYHLLATGEDKAKIIELRTRIQRFFLPDRRMEHFYPSTNQAWRDSQSPWAIRNRIFSTFCLENNIPNLDAKDLLRALLRKSFDLVNLTFKK